jgi:hypothetical protein
MWCGQKLTDLCSLPHIPEYNGIVVPTHSPIRACEEHRDLVHEYLLELAARSGLNLTLRLIGLALVVGGGVADNLAIAMSGAVYSSVCSSSSSHMPLRRPYAAWAWCRRNGSHATWES